MRVIVLINDGVLLHDIGCDGMHQG